MSKKPTQPPATDKAPKAAARSTPAAAGGAGSAAWRMSPWLVAALVFGVLIPLGLENGVWAGNGTDLYSYMVPMREAAQRLGWLPGWNPGPLGGTPAHAALQLGLLYPPNWPLRLFDSAHALEWSLWAHVAWLAGGGVFLSRQLAPTAPPVLHLLGAVLWAASGPLWGHVWAGHVSWVQALAWLPWWLGLAVRTIRDASPQAALWAALALALQLLAGHPQVSFVGGLGGGVLLLLTSASSAGSAGRPAAGRLAGGWALVVVSAVLAVALAAAQLWPTAQLAPHLNRSLSTPREIALAFESAPQTLLTALAPHAGGGPGPQITTWGGYHEALAFAGAGTLGLAALGSLGLGTAGGLGWLWVALCALLSIGSHGGLLPVLAETVPGFGAFRVPSRWILAAWPVLAWLLSAGLQAQLDKSTSRKPGALVLALVGVALLLTGLGWGADHPLLAPGLAKDVQPAALAVAVSQTRLALVTGAAAVLVAAAVGVWPLASRIAVLSLGVLALAQGLWFVSLHATTPPAKRMPAAAFHWSEATAAKLREATDAGKSRVATAGSLRHANRPGAIGLGGAGAYEPALSLLANRYGNLLAGRPLQQYAVNHQVKAPNAWLDRLATGVFVRSAADQRSAAAFAAWPELARMADAGGELVIHRNPEPMQRLGSAGKLVVEPDASRAVEMLSGLTADEVVVDRALPAPSGPPPALSWRTDTPERVEVDVVASGPAVVVLRDALAPGWSATLDGQPATIALADGLFRAVAVPAGRHALAFQYEVVGLKQGAMVSLGALLLFVVGWLALGRQRPAVKKRQN